MTLKVFFVAALVLAFAGIGNAGIVTLNFTEWTNKPVDGVSQAGVTLGFTGGTDATYGKALGTAGGTSPLLSDPVLEGDSNGTLTLTFLTPTPFLQFAVAIGLLTPSSFTVELFGSPSPTSSTVVPTTTPVFFSEGQFTYDNTLPGLEGTLISQARITFPANANRFGLDNLTFIAADVSVPEPGTWWLMGTGLLSALILARKRRV